MPPRFTSCRDELADDKVHMHSLYVRMKILTEEGKKYADVDLVYDQGRSFSIRAVDGRTIHSDGTVIPFTGKPFDKVLEKTKTESYKAKVFTLPDVQVGSILEYRYVLAYEDNWVLPPQWYIQQPLYVSKAHYSFIPSDRTILDSHGGGSENLAYTPSLPKGVEVKESLAPTTRVGSQDTATHWMSRISTRYRRRSTCRRCRVFRIGYCSTTPT